MNKPYYIGNRNKITLKNCIMSFIVIVYIIFNKVTGFDFNSNIIGLGIVLFLVIYFFGTQSYSKTYWIIDDISILLF